MLPLGIPRHTPGQGAGARGQGGPPPGAQLAGTSGARPESAASGSGQRGRQEGAGKMTSGPGWPRSPVLPGAL